MGMAPPPEPPALGPQILVVGDSKSLDQLPVNDWKPMLTQVGLTWDPDTLLAATGAYIYSSGRTGPWGNFGRSGYTTANAAAEVDAFVSQSQLEPDWILVNLGRNGYVESEAAYALDALHVRWPGAQVLVTKPWWRGCDVAAGTCSAIAASIDALVSTRSSWLAVGDDERIWLENGDNGTTYTDDGTHPNAAGAHEMAAQKKMAMGY